MTKIVAIIQARMGSIRLRGKVMLPILGEPLLWRLIERAKRARLLDELVVATSSEAKDELIIDLCQRKGVSYFRGSQHDVLSRYYHAACDYHADHIVRLTGDNPLVDPELIDEAIKLHLHNGYDYTSNTLDITYPDGLDVEVIRFDALKAAYLKAQLPSEREHVAKFIYREGTSFKLGSLKQAHDDSSFRLTVDESLDFEVVNAIYSALYPINSAFTTKDILAFLRKSPQWVKHNAMYKRNEGLQLALHADQDYLLHHERI